MSALPAKELARIARRSECDARTVLRYIAGAAVRPSTSKRIERAFRRLGMPDRIRPGVAAPPAEGTGG